MPGGAEHRLGGLHPGAPFLASLPAAARASPPAYCACRHWASRTRAVSLLTGGLVPQLALYLIKRNPPKRSIVISPKTCVDRRASIASVCASRDLGKHPEPLWSASKERPYRKATAAKALWEGTGRVRQDGSNKMSGQEDISRLCVCPHSCMESICAIQSKCQLFGCCQSFSRRVA